jgi:hypothetical protein
MTTDRDLAAVLALLGRELLDNPTAIRPLTVGDVREMGELVRDVVIDDPDEDLGPDFVMP